METDANRNVLTRTEYEPYGLSNRPTLDGPGFTGHVQDAATGLTYMQQRYYDPVIGRFLSVDPVTAYDSKDWRHFNRYDYAYNNPYKYKDPDGRVGLVGAVIGGVIEVRVQMAVEGKSFSQVDVSDVVVAMAVGAVAGGVEGGLLPKPQEEQLLRDEQPSRRLRQAVLQPHWEQEQRTLPMAKRPVGLKWPHLVSRVDLLLVSVHVLDYLVYRILSELQLHRHQEALALRLLRNLHCELVRLSPQVVRRRHRSALTLQPAQLTRRSSRNLIRGNMCA